MCFGARARGHPPHSDPKDHLIPSTRVLYSIEYSTCCIVRYWYSRDLDLVRAHVCTGVPAMPTTEPVGVSGRRDGVEVVARHGWA